MQNNNMNIIKRDKNYRQTYHANVVSGWSNDPNGTVIFDGKAHLFFQHYPHKAQWGTMHWGHYTTTDFIHWDKCPIALVPDQDYEVECGCCSGTAIVKDDTLVLMYTAAQSELQRQCLAYSKDGINFDKDKDNPILTASMLSPIVSNRDFRDPKVFMHHDTYYCIAGTRIIEDDSETHRHTYKTIDDENIEKSPSIGEISGGNGLDKGYGWGNLILLKSKDLYHWDFVGKFFEKQDNIHPAFFKLDGVYECPDMFTSHGKDIILASPQNLPQIEHEYENLHSGIYVVGELNYDTGHFNIEDIQELDGGFDFYASQTWHTDDDRTIMIAWKEMWDRNYPTQSDNWAGTYTLPRELEYKDGRLYQYPVREIKDYRTNKVSYKDIKVKDTSVSFKDIKGNVLELHVDMDVSKATKAGVKVFKGDTHETYIYLDKTRGCVTFDRTDSGIRLVGREENVSRRHVDLGNTDSITFDIFLDVSSVEVFIDGGRYTMTSNIFPDEEDINIEFVSEGQTIFKEIIKYDIEV